LTKSKLCSLILGLGKKKHKAVEENYDLEIVLGTEAKVSLRHYYGRRCTITVTTNKVEREKRDDEHNINSSSKDRKVRKEGMTTNVNWYSWLRISAHLLSALYDINNAMTTPLAPTRQLSIANSTVDSNINRNILTLFKF
jgi:hypothetical protein